MKKSRLLSAFLMLALPAGLLFAHGQQEAGSAAKHMTLTEMDYYSSGTGNTVMKKFIAEYEKANPGITVQRDAVPGQSLLQKVLTEATANALPDLLMLDNPMVQEVASAGVLIPLNKLGSLDRSSFFNGSIAEGLYKGNFYALADNNNTIALFYNKTMLADAGISSPPKTWAELRTDAKKLTRGSVHGFAFSGGHGIGNVAWQTEPLFWTNGGHLRNMDSAAMQQTLTFLLSMIKDGSMPEAVVNWNQGNVQNEFQEGRIAMMINGPWIVPTLDTFKNIHYGIAAIPTPKAGQSVISPLGGEVWTVPKTNAASEQAAFKMLKWMWVSNKRQTEWATVAGAVIPTYKPALSGVLARYPFLDVFAKEVRTARPRTEYLGANYPKAVQIWGTAVQSALTGNQSVAAALKTAQQSMKQVLNGNS